MCVVGLYLAFLVLEDVIVANYSTDAASQDQDMKVKAAFDIFEKNFGPGKDDELILNDGKPNFRYSLNISVTSEKPNKKWELERVTQKQYEIINMLCSKTKTFVNKDSTIYTTNPTKQENTSRRILNKNDRSHNPIKFSALTSPSHTMTTPSKIEFYYMYDTQNQANKQKCSRASCKQTIEKAIKSKVTSNLPFLVFHIRSPYLKPRSNKFNVSLNEPVKIIRIQTNKLQADTQQVEVEQNSYFKEVKNKISGQVTRKIPPIEYLFGSAALGHRFIPVTINNFTCISDYDLENSSESTTIYDKIKFFEIYDQNTRIPNIKKAKVNNNDVEVITNEHKVLLEHVDQGSHDHRQAKHAKKHITGNFQNIPRPCCQKTDGENAKSTDQKANLTFKRYSNETAYVSNENFYKSVFPYENNTAPWSEYPFAAVYIYEPLQVHCDAAAINTYWLVASGACLSRVSKKPYGGSQSAFVAYCGEQWWQPERVAYVKYSFVHPWFHPRDKTRKHLYNIGVIQVVNSMMSACTGWAPVSLMSHQFAADPEGSWALAVGWGLDRFDRKYGATDLPRTPLMMFKSVLYFDSCPGNIGYSKAKRLDEGGGLKNVHCLSLPPYSGEENDPVHGGLLLVGGKLVALYLQEERRPWGEQSALYTGVWSLIPWVMEVAKEPDEIDTLILDL